MGLPSAAAHSLSSHENFQLSCNVNLSPTTHRNASLHCPLVSSIACLGIHVNCCLMHSGAKTTLIQLSGSNSLWFATAAVRPESPDASQVNIIHSPRALKHIRQIPRCANILNSRK